MSNHTTLSSLFDDIAEAIRDKDGTSESIVADTFPERIAAIDTDPSGDATATAADILSPKTAYAGGQKLTGTIAKMTLPTSTVTATPAGTNKLTIGRDTSTRYLAIPAGYNSAAAYYTISGVANMAVPSSVSSKSSGAGRLTIYPSASSTQYLNLPVGYNSTAYYYAFSPVKYTVTAAKIAAGQVVTIGDASKPNRIADITGTYTNDATAKAADILTGKTAYVKGSKITGSMADATITNNTTLPDGSTSSGTIDGGSYIKIGAGYNSTDKYYLAQADAHSSYTPSPTYFQKSTTGAVTAAVIEANKYASSTYYVKAMTLPTAASSTSSGTAKATIDPSTSAQYLNIPTGYNNSPYYYTFRPVTHTVTAEKIAAGQTVRIGDAGDSTRIAYIMGTYTGDATAKASDILQSKTAYVKGKKIAGTIKDVTITNNTTLPDGSTSSGTIDGGSYIKIGAGYNSTDKYYLAQADAHSSYTPSSTYFSTSTTGTVSDAKIEADKYATSTYYVKQGSFTVSAGEDYIATPVISKQTISISGVTDAANGDATTTAPSSGVYVKVKSAADTGTVSYVKSATAGWINSESDSYHAAGTGGANASADTYIPIKTASPAFDGGAVTGSVTGITGSNVTLSDTNNGISVTGAASATRGAVLYNGAVSGWVTKADNASALAAGSATTLTGKTRYITAITVPKDVPFSLSAAADTALDTTSDINITNAGYRHVKVSSSGTGNITVTHNGGTTAVNSNGQGSVTVTDSSLKSKYVDRGAINSWQATASNSSAELTVDAYDTSGGSLSGAKYIVDSGAWVTTTVTPSTSQKGPYYGRVIVNAVASMTLPTATITSGQSGTNKLTINRATGTRYLQIPAGYNSTAAYYTISGVADMTLPTAAVTTAPSGTNKATISRSTSTQYISIPTGYNASAAYYTISAVPNASPTFDGGAVSGSVSVASSTMTLANDDPNGIRLSITGSGTATRAAVLYNGAVEGYVSKADNATALAAGSATALTGATKYITNINVPAGKTLHLTGAGGTDSSYSSIFVDSAGNYSYIDVTGSGSDTVVKLSDGSSRYGSLNVTDSTTNTNGGTSWSAGSATSGYLMASGYNSSGTAEMYKDLIVGGKWVSTEVTPSTSAQGPFYGRVNVKAATMASVSVSGTAMTITGGIVQMN